MILVVKVSSSIVVPEKLSFEVRHPAIQNQIIYVYKVKPEHSPGLMQTSMPILWLNATDNLALPVSSQCVPPPSPGRGSWFRQAEN